MESRDNKVTLLDWWKHDSVGTKTAKTMCAELNISYVYFKHVAHRRRRASVDLAFAMIAWARENTPDLVMSIDTMLVPNDQINRGKQTAAASRYRIAKVNK